MSMREEANGCCLKRRRGRRGIWHSTHATCASVRSVHLEDITRRVGRGYSIGITSRATTGNLIWKDKEGNYAQELVYILTTGSVRSVSRHSGLVL